MKVFTALVIVAATLITTGLLVSEDASAASKRASTAPPAHPIPIQSENHSVVSGTGANMRRRVVCSGDPPHCVRR